MGTSVHLSRSHLHVYHSRQKATLLCHGSFPDGLGMDSEGTAEARKGGTVVSQPPARPGQAELPRILHLGDSRSANRQLITAWRPLTPLRLCSAKCVMEMRPQQTLLPRGTLALLSRGFAPGEPGKGLRCRGEFIKSMSFPRHPIPHLPLTLGCNTIFPGPHSEEGPP